MKDKNPLRTKYIWLDGKFVPFDKAQVHILNHTLHYGSGVYEGERFYKTEKGSAIFRLEDHTKRLFFSAETIGAKIPYSQKKIIEATRELVVKNKLEEGYIRPLVFYGEKMRINPTGNSVHIAIAVWPWGTYLGEQPIKVKIVKTMRLDPRSVVSSAKITGYYANSILAGLEATRAGFDEAVLLDSRGYIGEGPVQNIFIVKRGVLITPKLGSILPGITRESVMTIARDLKIKVVEKSITPAELKNADEVFFTGTAVEVTPIGQVDTTKIAKGNAGPITEKIRGMYMRIVRGKEEKYSKWLTVVK